MIYKKYNGGCNTTDLFLWQIYFMLRIFL